jgi:hypothetical protein
MKRNLMVILLIALLAIPLVMFISGCGGNATGATVTPPAVTAAETTAPAPAAEPTQMAAAAKIVAPIEPAATAFGQTVTIPGKMEITLLGATMASEVTYNIDSKEFRLIEVKVKITARTSIIEIKTSLAGQDGKKIRCALPPSTRFKKDESRPLTFQYQIDGSQKIFTFYIDEAEFKIGTPPTIPGTGISF